MSTAIGLGVGLPFDRTPSGLAAALALNLLSDVLDQRVSFSRASNATMIDRLGRSVWAPHNFMLNPVPGNATSVVTNEVPPPPGTNLVVRKLTATTNDPQLGVFSQTLGHFLTGVRSYTIQAWVYAVGSSIGKTTRFWLFRDGVTDVQTSANVTLTGGWQFVSATLTMTSAPTTNLTARIDAPDSAAVDDVVYIAGFQLEYTSANSPQPFSSVLHGSRLDYNPATLALRGLLSEPQRTNSIRNSSQVGGTAGTPGAPPTNWSISSIAGITITTAYGVEDGIPYIDVSYSGTNTSGSTAFPTIAIESAGAIAAANGQTWTHSVYARKIAGADPIGGWVVGLVGRDAAQALISGQSAITALTSGASLAVGRVSASFTFTDPLIAFAQPRVTGGSVAAGATMDITIRFGGNQFEQGAFATSLIPTFGAAATRAGDVADLIPDPPWNPAGMTYCAQFERLGNPANSSGEATSALFYFGDASSYVNGVFGFGASNQVRCDMADAGVPQSQVSVTPQPCVPFQVYKWATRIAPNDAIMYANGVAGTPDTTVTMPAALGVTRRSIGRSNAATAQQMHGWLRGLQVYTSALDNTQLQALST